MINLLTGLDVLLDEKCARLKGLRVGLLTNLSSTTHDLRPNVDALRDAGANIVAFFTPEHGLSGAVVQSRRGGADNVVREVRRSVRGQNGDADGAGIKTLTLPLPAYQERG